MWVYSGSFGDCNGDCTLVSKGNNGSNPSGYWVYTSQSGALSVDIANGGSTATVSGGNLTVNTWHHVVVTLKNWTVSLYLDGQHKALSNISHYIAYGSEDFLLCGIDSSTNYFKGFIDDFRFWYGDMSSTEVSELYETNVEGLHVIGALAGYPLIKNCMNQGYEVIEHILGHPVTPAHCAS